MKHLNRQHPVVVILQEAARGNQPTKAFLDRLLVRDDLPEGHDLNRHRRAVAASARKIAEVGRPTPNSWNHGSARKLADSECYRLADLMSDEEAAITRTEPNPESSDTIAARMFRR